MFKFSRVLFCLACLISLNSYAEELDDNLIETVTSNQSTVVESVSNNTSINKSNSDSKQNSNMLLGVSNKNIKSSAPQDYTVKKTDTVIKVAQKYLNKLSLWPSLLGVDSLSTTKLYPGDKLKLINVDGSRKILVISLANSKGNYYQKLTPQVRIEQVNDTDYISVANLKQFMKNPIVMNKESYNSLPTVVGSSNDLAVYYSMGDSIYVKNFVGNVGDRVMVLSDLRALKDPNTKEFLGEEYRVNGYGVISQVGKISSLELTSAIEPIISLNRVLKLDNTMSYDIVPHHMDNEVSGQIIALYDSLSATGEYNNVVINRGSRDGVEVGAVFDINDGRKFKDPTSNSDDDRYFDAPAQEIGELLVYKVYDKVSFALVTDSQSEIIINSKIRSQ